jgi:hypothetical protein
VELPGQTLTRWEVGQILGNPNATPFGFGIALGIIIAGRDMLNIQGGSYFQERAGAGLTAIAGRQFQPLPAGRQFWFAPQKLIHMHNSIQMTVDIYGHLIQSSNREMVRRLDTQPSATQPQSAKIEKAQPLGVAPKTN